MKINFYNRFIQPLSSDPYSAARETVMNVILVGLITLGLTALLTTFAGFMLADYTFVVPRLFSIAVVTAAFCIFYYLSRYRAQHKAVAFMLVLATFLCAGLMANQWGLLLPVPLLLFALATVMAGILISSRFSLFAAGLTMIILSTLQVFHAKEIVRPDLSWMGSSSTAGDVIGYGGFIFGIAVLTWLFNRQMEFSLKRAKRAEAELLRQNDLLEEKVIARTRELEKEQLEKMQQMYRFAELGHVSTALFHDLANHLSTVSLDIETLQKRTQPEILGRIDDNIRYIDTIVQRVRSQLRGRVKDETFDIVAEVREIMKVLTFAADKLSVQLVLDTENRKPVLHKGDPLRFRQVIMNLLSNAIEAHRDIKSRAKQTDRMVAIRIRTQNKMAMIDVIDHGSGIPPRVRERIFDPFYTSKAKGVGIGLFIVRQVLERDFKGEVKLVSTGRNGTTFAVSLPLKR